MRKVFEFLDLKLSIKTEPELQTGAINYNVLRLKTVAAIYEKICYEMQRNQNPKDFPLKVNSAMVLNRCYSA